MEGTFWALVPPILAIALALITKEVYFAVAGIAWRTSLRICGRCSDGDHSQYYER